MLKIGLSGKANVGKNTVADLFDQYLNYDCIYHTAFATPIKNMALELFPWADSTCLFGSSHLRNNIIPRTINQNDKPLTYRQVLIDLGTLARSYNPEHWINLYHYNIQNLYAKCEFRQIEAIIAEDVRYKNELEYLKKENYYLIRIVRNNINNIDHISETGQDAINDKEFDFIIDNNGTLEELQQNVQQIVQKIKPISK